MAWLEMSRDEDHGGPGWGFTVCLWSPARKRSRDLEEEVDQTWPFWESLLQIGRGDSIIHLRGIGAKAAFVGHSVAATDGYETKSRPPQPGQWGYASRFYRVDLSMYRAFPDPIRLDSVFRDRREDLERYLQENAMKGRRSSRRLFYVRQRERLQCLMGAYCSEVDETLGAVLFGEDYSLSPSDRRPAWVSVPTGEAIRELKARIGQGKFSEEVRAAYYGRCCFPGCEVDDERLLVAAHIARWADDPSLRGNVGNGLCLCKLHDAAFEVGMFTLSLEGLVRCNPERAKTWGTRYLTPREGHPILRSSTPPVANAIRAHWARIGFSPSGT